MTGGRYGDTILQFNTGFYSGEDWSPDGTKIAFFRHAFFGNESGIYTIKPDGTGLTPLAVGGPPFALDPSWSPDGKKIAFSRGGLHGPNVFYNPGEDIWVMNADGSGQVQLTTDPGLDSEPVWSPDGRKIAFESTRDDPDSPACASHPEPICKNDLYVMNADGSAQTNITNSPNESEDSPTWQPLPNRPPDCSTVSAGPDTLWPPNHKLVPVSLSAATDPDGDPVTITVTGVSQDEPTSGAPDVTLGPGSNEVSLRAERSGSGDGRLYRIAFKASDGKGGECTGSTTVAVPHSAG